MRWTIAVFVRRGKSRWLFEACCDCSEGEGCNLVSVEARDLREAKAKAVKTIKARMNLDSQLAPSDVKVRDSDQPSPANRKV